MSNKMWVLTFGIIPAIALACKLKHWKQQQEQADSEKAYFSPREPLYGRRVV